MSKSSDSRARRRAMEAITSELGEEIRIGILVRSRMRQVANARIWYRKDGNGVGMSFSSYLLELAGGIDRLLSEWEPK